MEQNSDREGRARALGAGEIHIVCTENYSFIVPAYELGEALKMDKWGLEHSFDEGRWLRDVDLRYFNVRDLCLLGLDADLEVFVHCIKTPVRSTRLGTLQLRGPRLLFNGVELSGKVFEWDPDDKALEGWLYACVNQVWKDWSFDQERATELAKLIVTDLREAERRSLETLRRTLGDEVADRLLREKQIAVRSRNGGEYTITDSGEVFETSSGIRVCVEVDGGRGLPRYDRVLAKYLVIRDHPEQIETLGRTSSLEMEREGLREEIAELEEHLAVLKGHLAMLGG